MDKRPPTSRRCSRHSVHGGTWPRWPEWRHTWEPSIVQVLRSGQWYRGSGEQVQRFEAAYAELLGAKRCLATASGTTALMVAMHVLDVDAGDEVIVSPFTFIASYNAILLHKALPVLADTDPATLTIDPASIDRVTERTGRPMPVHIYGMPATGSESCDCESISSRPRGRVSGVWRTRTKCGTIGAWAASRPNRSTCVGGVARSRATAEPRHRAGSCQRWAPVRDRDGAPHPRVVKLPLQHFQAAMLLQQLDKLREETAVRQQNAARLSASLKEIPGITPARLPDNSQAVWHLFPFRYDASRFQGLSRETFIRAMRAEGIPCSTGYREQYYDGLLDEAIASRGFKRLYGAQRLKQYRDSFQELKGNRQVCATTVAVTQNLLLADPAHIARIPEAIRKIQAYAGELAKT